MGISFFHFPKEVWKCNDGEGAGSEEKLSLHIKKSRFFSLLYTFLVVMHFSSPLPPSRSLSCSLDPAALIDAHTLTHTHLPLRANKRDVACSVGISSVVGGKKIGLLLLLLKFFSCMLLPSSSSPPFISPDTHHFFGGDRRERCSLPPPKKKKNTRMGGGPHT